MIFGHDQMAGNKGVDGFEPFGRLQSGFSGKANHACLFDIEIADACNCIAENHAATAKACVVGIVDTIHAIL